MEQRQCLILKGESEWCHSSLPTLLAEFDKDRTIFLSNHSVDTIFTIPQKKSQSQLGKEFDLVIFDACEQFDPDSLGIIMGTIRAGGSLILVLSPAIQSSLWMKRFESIVAEFSQQYDSFMLVEQGQVLPKLSPPIQREKSDCRTDDQQQAIAAISKVVHGHRRRPLVISSDRGRGKSAALGIAAAELILQGKTKIIVTAPSRATVDTVFEHADRLLLHGKRSQGSIQYKNAEIKFIAPDALLQSDIQADLLLVDEAADIPTPILEKLLHKFSRIVFATTLHGYEGTGRGFVIRFQKILDQVTPDWRKLEMITPIRWDKEDRLENFGFQALLLNAVPVADELICDASIELCEFEYQDRKQLLTDEKSLTELFGLMVLAHYRTRPSDLQMMLDRQDVSVYVMRYQGHIIASAWLVEEGDIDEQLSADIHAGNRRLKGHLLPQSLLSHAGITTAGALKYQRIIRIAVHPAIQHRGIGQRLISDIKKHVHQNQTDVLGASFAASTDLLAFWHKTDFVPVRLGLHQDDVSGSHAIMMLNACSERGGQLLEQAQQRLQQQWTYLLSTHFKALDADLLITVSQLIPPLQLELTQWDKQDIYAFAYEQKGFEFSQHSLVLWLKTMVCQPEFIRLEKQQQQLLMMLVLQQREMAEVCKQLTYTGKRQVVTALREAVKQLIDLSANKLLDEK